MSAEPCLQLLPMRRRGDDDSRLPGRQPSACKATHRIDEVGLRFIHENPMVRRAQVTPVHRQHAGLTTRMLCGALRPMLRRSTRSDRRHSRDNARAHGQPSFPLGRPLPLSPRA